jgi:fructosamine-3-kinase
MVSASGASYWARTAKLTVVDANGREDNYFFKVHQGERGRKMVSTEYESMMALYRIMPEIVASPVGWGAYEEMEDTYFCVCEYHQMSDDVPDVSHFPALVAELHKQGASPDGRFGYALETYGGNNPQLFPPSDRREECFRLGLGAIMDAEVKTHGPDADLEKLIEQTVTKVIPRLSKPLETEGRSIIPRLVHGDLWDGNFSLDVTTGQPLIFDATPLTAHS